MDCIKSVVQAPFIGVQRAPPTVVMIRSGGTTLMEPISSTSFLKVNISGADDSTGEMVESSEFSVRGRGTLSADTDGADDNEEAFVDFPSTHRRMSLASSDGARDVGPNGGVSHSEISKCHENMVRNQPGPNVHLTMDPAAYLANKSGDNDKHAHVKISTLTVLKQLYLCI
jgi:hypothetical protein